MKRTIFGCIAVTIAIMVMGGCVSGPKNDSAQDVTSSKDASRVAISYADQPRGQLSVKSLRNERLVLFAGSIVNEKILGGIEPNGNRSFELNGIIPNGNGVFVLRAVKETDYRDAGTGATEVFAQMVVYDSDDKDAQSSIIIDKSLGGSDQVIFQNDTDYVVQIAVNGLDGNIITTLQRGERHKVVTMEPNRDGYTFFPVYLGYSQKDKQIVKLSPASMENGKWVLPMPTSKPDEIPFIPFDNPGSLSGLTSPVAYLSVKNGFSAGVRLTYGRQPLPTQAGLTGLNPGRTGVFELKAAPDGSVWDGLEIDRNIGEKGRTPIEAINVKAGYTYELVINSQGQYQIDRNGKPKSQSELSQMFEIEYLVK